MNSLIARAFALLFLATLTLHAQVPQIINYQGRVAVGGVNFDGSGQFKFALVDGAGTTFYWTHDDSLPLGTPLEPGSVPDGSVHLTVTKGLYSVLLGDTSLVGMTGIPNSVFANPDVRLRVWFHDGTNGDQLLTPDQRIAAVGYAMVAGGVNLPATTSASVGVITQGGSRLLHTFGDQNFFVGPEAGNFTMTGAFNTASGFQALSSSTSGNHNTASGYRALHTNTTGYFNTAYGSAALHDNVTGGNNIALGIFAGYNLTTGSNNIAIGNGGVAGESNIIRIGTSQTDTYLAGIIHGDGSGLTGLNASNITTGTLNLAGTLTVSNSFGGFRSVGDGGTFSLFDTGNVARGTLALPQGAGQYSDDAVGNDIVLRAVTGKLLLQSGEGASAIAIDTNNNVGIGTATPTAKLDVAGTVKGTAFVGDGAGLTGITAVSVATPPGMALIPAGAFTMGDSLDGLSNAVPVSTTVSAFYIEVNEVSLSQWQAVYNWATLLGGYTFVNAGAGKGPNHPVQTVDWYDAVKWCNALSEQAGKPPVYYTDAGLTAVYRTGEVAVFVNWTAKGYRLPTEAEWEKAARGGLSGQRFPWGDTIAQKLANYYGDTGSSSYDLGPNGFNAIGSIGGTSPATSPVGSFGANGYGLNDMAGNVFEWCWDWYGTPYAGGSDPHGAATGSFRVLRGGSWFNDVGADGCRSARRNGNSPVVANINFGFRVVLPPGQP